jgi:hypothetical protein
LYSMSGRTGVGQRGSPDGFGGRLTQCATTH